LINVEKIPKPIRSCGRYILFKIREDKPRASTLFIKKLNRKNLIGVEIGAAEGVNAKHILKNLDIEKLYLIDPYEPYTENLHIFKNHVNGEKKLLKRLKPYKGKIVLITHDSESVALMIPDNLDFVYIDGNHDYEYVKKDIELYYPKIKKGGILSGHNFAVSWLGVYIAVVEFILKNNLRLYAKDLDWWMIKPKKKK
jgi:hypothetical protein